MGIDLLLIGVVVFVASLVDVFSGFGTSTVMVPVMLLFFPLPLTLLFVGVMHWFSDIWKMLFFRPNIRPWKLILWFAVPGIIASYIGANISVTVSEEVLLRILGGFLLAYVLFILWKPEWKLPVSNLTVSAGGLTSGLAAGTFGVGGVIRGALLSASNLPKEVYFFISGAMGLMINSTRIAGYVVGGTRLEGLFLWGLLVFIPLSFLGSLVAKRLVDRVPQKHFRIFIKLFLAVVAVKFLIFPI